MSKIEERVWLAERLAAAIGTVELRGQALKRAHESYLEAVRKARELSEEMEKSAADDEN